MSEMMTIEKFAIESDTSNEVMAGLKVQNGWKSGKQMTKEEFEKAKKAFLDGRADGKKIAKSAYEKEGKE